MSTFEKQTYAEVRSQFSIGFLFERHTSSLCFLSRYVRHIYLMWFKLENDREGGMQSTLERVLQALKSHTGLTQASTRVRSSVCILHCNEEM